MNAEQIAVLDTARLKIEAVRRLTRDEDGAVALLLEEVTESLRALADAAEED